MAQRGREHLVGLAVTMCQAFVRRRLAREAYAVLNGMGDADPADDDKYRSRRGDAHVHGEPVLRDSASCASVYDESPLHSFVRPDLTDAAQDESHSVQTKMALSDPSAIGHEEPSIRRATHEFDTQSGCDPPECAHARELDASKTSAETHHSSSHGADSHAGSDGSKERTDHQGAVTLQRVYRGHLARHLSRIEKHLQLVCAPKLSIKPCRFARFS